MYENAPKLWKIWENFGIPPAKCWFHPSSIFRFSPRKRQVRVVKVYVSCNPPPPSPSPRPPPPDLNCKQTRGIRSSGPRRTSTASSGRTVRSSTSTASSWSQCSPPDLNYKESPKIYQVECKKECQKICQIECQKECQNICQKVWGMMSEYMPDRMPDRMSGYMPERMTSRWYVRNYVRIMYWSRVGITRRK